jgi:DNA-binding transcriptional LysR family regulator
MANTKQFDMNLLRVFDAVCHRGSFTLAAEELELTQSSVSNAITRLKTVIGEELFIRVGRGIKPTAFAAGLYQQLHQPLAEIEQVLMGLEEFDSSKAQRTFVILANDVIIRKLQGTLDKLVFNSGIEIIFKESPHDETEIETALMFEQVDLVLHLDFSDLKMFSRQKILEEEVVCVASATHPRLQGGITVEQFLAEKHILFSGRFNNLPMAQALNNPIMSKRLLHGEQSSLLGVMASVSKCEAIGLIPKSYTDEYAAVFGLQIFPIPFPTPKLEVCMFWKNKLNQNKANKWLRDTIVSIL